MIATARSTFGSGVAEVEATVQHHDELPGRSGWRQADSAPRLS